MEKCPNQFPCMLLCYTANVSIFLLYQGYFMKAIVLLSNLELFSGSKALWPLLFLG